MTCRPTQRKRGTGKSCNGMYHTPRNRVFRYVKTGQCAVRTGLRSFDPIDNSPLHTTFCAAIDAQGFRAKVHTFMPVVVVESPAKAKTINKYLGSDYTVLASYGHVRDLPPKDGSVDPDHEFDMKWEIASRQQKTRQGDCGCAGKRQRTDPCNRPRPRRRSDQLALARGADQAQIDQERHPRQPRGVQRNHQRCRDRSDEKAASGRYALGRGVSCAPRAGLSGGL